MERFNKPNFDKYPLELRYENGIVCIYGTIEGLKKLIQLCENLISNPSQGHIHLEEGDILTDNSEKGAIAVFENE